MVEISLEYMNKIASQLQFISALLSGFSLTVLALLFDNKRTDKITINIFRLAILATGAFLVSIFAMTNIFMVTSEGFPFEVKSSDLTFPKAFGFSSFLIGIFSMILIISLFGWTKSKSLGRFSTSIGIIAFLLIILMLFQVG